MTMTVRQKSMALVFGATAMLASIPVSAVAESPAVETLGPDHSRASLAETLTWLRQQVPGFASSEFTQARVHYPPVGSPPPHYFTVGPEVDDLFTKFAWRDADSCNLHFQRTMMTIGNEEQTFNMSDKRKLVTDVYHISLGELDPSSITVEQDSEPNAPLHAGNELAFGICIEGRNAHGLQLEGFGSYISLIQCKHWPYNGLPIQDRESALRVAKALKHAAILCGAKVAPF